MIIPSIIAILIYGKALVGNKGKARSNQDILLAQTTDHPILSVRHIPSRHPSGTNLCTTYASVVSYKKDKEPGGIISDHWTDKTGVKGKRETSGKKEKVVRPSSTKYKQTESATRWRKKETETSPSDRYLQRSVAQARLGPHNMSRFQSTKRFSCSSVKKMRMVVGWRRVHAGSHPLNMNIAPSFASDARITPSVDCMRAW